MKTRNLAVVAGASAPMILGGAALAGFGGIEVRSVPNPYGLLVCDVYAVFDRPGADRMLVVAGTEEQSLNISVIKGTFYQHPLGGDTAPLAASVVAFPSLQYDSFVTIGVESVGPPGGQPSNGLFILKYWPGFGPGTLFSEYSGWGVTPAQLQSDPFDPIYCFPGDGRALIGRFSTLDGLGLSGTFRMLVRSNNVTTQVNAAFFHVPSPGVLALVSAWCLIGSRRGRGGADPCRPPHGG